MKNYAGFTVKEWIVIGATLLLALFAIGVGLGYITIGVHGISFLF